MPSRVLEDWDRNGHLRGRLTYVRPTSGRVIGQGESTGDLPDRPVLGTKSWAAEACHSPCRERGRR